MRKDLILLSEYIRYLAPVPHGLENMPVDEALKHLRGWFLNSFKDPVDYIDIDSEEIRYDYACGGPFETGEILDSAFLGSLSKDLRETFMTEVQTRTDIWFPNLTKVEESSEDYNAFIELVAPFEYYRAMLERIAAVDELLDKRHRPGGIGHNKPPESIEEEPLNDADFREVSDALNSLKQQPLRPINERVATEAAATITSKVHKIRDWLAGKADTFATEATKEAGKEFGKWAPRVFWALLLERMLGVTEAITHWLKALGFTF